MSHSKRSSARSGNRYQTHIQVERDLSSGEDKELEIPEKIPVTYQDLHSHLEKVKQFKPLPLRLKTMEEIEKKTRIPLICYVTKIYDAPREAPTYIDDFDLVGFTDLIKTTPGKEVDVFLVSNGGNPEATERIVKLLRNQYSKIRFLIPANAYSAATLLCLSGNEIIMTASATLGPIDPQINGIPFRAMKRAFEKVKDELKSDPKSLPAYVPLLQKYDLPLLEIGNSAEELSRELARNWLSQYMLELPNDCETITGIVNQLADYDLNKSHARGFDRSQAMTMGLKVIKAEDAVLDELINSLWNQYALAFDKSPMVKAYENCRGITWGKFFGAFINQSIPPYPNK